MSGWNTSRKLERNIPIRSKLPYGLLSQGAKVDKILLAIFVAATGSLLLPAMRLVPAGISRRIWKAPRSAAPSEIKKHTDDVPLAPRARGRRLEFRPLTTDEKKEFENSMEGKRNPLSSKRLAYFPSPTSVP